MQVQNQEHVQQVLAHVHGHVWPGTCPNTAYLMTVMTDIRNWQFWLF